MTLHRGASYRSLREERKIFSYQRDHFVRTSDLVFPFQDDVSGTIRGYRVFTACRTINGKIFRLEDHLQRLYRSAEAIYMQPPMPRDDLRRTLNQIVRKNLEEAPGEQLHIEVIFSGGLLDNTMRQSNKGAHLYVSVQALVTPARKLTKPVWHWPHSPTSGCCRT